MPGEKLFIFFQLESLNRNNAPALLARSGACDRLQPVQGALASKRQREIKTPTEILKCPPPKPKCLGGGHLRLGYFSVLFYFSYVGAG